ncbi:MAG: alpha/beta fold hydrolase [Pseudonocardia sp.]|uniref:alpha/beta fold hydrolase n=1 Tax=unclassified Pseudonocardia TaxID=2619320 RepID=UPI000A6013F4|nr:MULTISPECIES: alpha/beta fold hydrolase [unclassified Pseudonocardia]MBN9113480.1 alpha/beta fold hydrolase [Pseudonocardia sp.]
MSRSFGVTVRGHRTRIVDAGRGEPVVLVHGTPLDLTSWDGVVAAVPGRRTVRYDVRGHGAAAGTPVPGPQELAADLVAVLDEVNVEAAHLVGHSWGGEIVLQTALDHPQRVSRLSVVCSRAAPFPAFLDVAAGLRAGTADRTVSLARWFTADELAADGPVVAAVRTRLETADAQAWAGALDMIAGFDVMAALPAITVPVDVVAAEFDGVAVPGHMAAIAAALPRSRYLMVTGAHHLLPMQEPGLVGGVLTAGD